MLARFGAKPPSSPTPVESPFSCKSSFSVWNTSAPMRIALEKFSAPAGTSMNSWKSIPLSACAPPFSTLSIGTGMSRAPTPPR